MSCDSRPPRDHRIIGPEHVAYNWNAEFPGRTGVTVVALHSNTPFGIVTFSIDVSFGGITCRAAAVAQPAVPPPFVMWVTPSRNDTLEPGATVSDTSGAGPKKSRVVLIEFVGRGAPVVLNHKIPG